MGDVMRWSRHILGAVSLAIVFVAGCSAASDDTSEPTHFTDEDGGGVQDFRATVVRVIDGDTLKLLTDDQDSVVIDLEGLDAPELSQPSGAEARDALRALVEERKVEVISVRTFEGDNYSRQFAEVLVGDLNVGNLLLRDGWAWQRPVAFEDADKATAEQSARDEKIGLWAEANPLAPWDWKSPPDDGEFYIQGNGVRYHRADCPTLSSDRTKISLEDAIRTHSPCRICHPPSEAGQNPAE